MIDTWPEQKHSDEQVRLGAALVGESFDEIENSTRGVTLGIGLEDPTHLGGKKTRQNNQRKRASKAEAKQIDFDDLLEATYDSKKELREAATKLKAYKWNKINRPIPIKE